MADDGFVDYVAPGEQPPLPSQPAGDHGFADYVAPGQTEPTHVASHKPFTLMDTWPVRMAKTLWGGMTAPHDVYTGQYPTLTRDILAGKATPATDEAIGRSFELATVANPVAPGLRGVGGAHVAHQIEAQPSAAQEAARTAVEAGAPLPTGLVSENPMIRATTQGARQLPFVGPGITEQVGKTVEATGEKVGELSRNLGQGVTDRTTAGAQLRPTLENVVDQNKQTIDTMYNNARSMIDADRQAPVMNATKVLDRIVATRSGAGSTTPMSGLEDVINLATRPQGASFNDLQRARSILSDKINFFDPHAGYTMGDLKQLRGALTQDMEQVVRQTAVNPVQAGAAVTAWKVADKDAAPLFEFDRTIKQLTRRSSDESLTGALVGAANAKTGNAQLLAKLRSSMPAADFERISGVALHELGASQKMGGAFSLNQFATNWSKMSAQGKAALFSPQHRSFLDDVANLGTFLKDADKYLNTSNTAGSAGVATVAGAIGATVPSLLTGNVFPFVSALGALGGGYGLGKYLARPASAAALARWARTAQAVSAGNRGAAGAAALRLAERNVLNNIPELQDYISQLRRTPEGYPYVQAPAKDQTNLPAPTPRRQ